MIYIRNNKKIDIDKITNYQNGDIIKFTNKNEKKKWEYIINLYNDWKKINGKYVCIIDKNISRIKKREENFIKYFKLNLCDLTNLEFEKDEETIECQHGHVMKKEEYYQIINKTININIKKEYLRQAAIIIEQCKKYRINNNNYDNIPTELIVQIEHIEDMYLIDEYEYQNLWEASNELSYEEIEKAIDSNNIEDIDEMIHELWNNDLTCSSVSIIFCPVCIKKLNINIEDLLKTKS